MRKSSSSLAAAVERGIVIVFTIPSKRLRSIPSAVEATHLAAWKKKSRFGSTGQNELIKKDGKHWDIYFTHHIRTPTAGQASCVTGGKAVNPCGFNSQFLALKLHPLYFHFTAPKPIQHNSNQSLADDCPSWWTAVHIWKMSTTNAFRRFLCALLVESELRSWKCYRGKFLPSELSNQQQTRCSRNRNVNGKLQKGVLPPPPQGKKWQLQQG